MLDYGILVCDFIKNVSNDLALRIRLNKDDVSDDIKTDHLLFRESVIDYVQSNAFLYRYIFVDLCNGKRTIYRDYVTFTMQYDYDINVKKMPDIIFKTDSDGATRIISNLKY